MRKWQKFLSLSLRDKALIVLTIFMFPLARFGLWLLGLKNLLVFLKYISPDIREFTETQHLIEKASLISQPINMCRSVLGLTCLEASVVAWWLFRWQNIIGTLCLGVPLKVEKLVEAHAWIECYNTVVNDSADIHNRYNVLTVYDNR